MHNCYLGLDIGGTKCAAVLGRRENDGFSVLERVQIPTVGTWQEVLEKLFAAADEILQGAAEKPVACGISCGGPLSSKTGEILSPPNLPGWDGVPIVKMAESHFGIPAALQNDANACALAEWMFGAGKDCRNMVFLTFGTGMGAGLILNGQLYDGVGGMAGEVGHMRLAEEGPVGYGKAGSFEGFCSGGGLPKLAAFLAERDSDAVSLGEYTTAKDIMEAAAAGDTFAKKVVSVSADYLGRALALLIDILNPERIVIGSIFARCENLLRKEMEAALLREVHPACLSHCQIVPAKLGEAVGDMAALCVAVLAEEMEKGGKI